MINDCSLVPFLGLNTHCKKDPRKKQDIELAAETTLHFIVISFEPEMRLQHSVLYFHKSMYLLQHYTIPCPVKFDYNDM